MAPPAVLETPQDQYGREANNYASKVSKYLDQVSKTELPPPGHGHGIPCAPFTTSEQLC